MSDDNEKKGVVISIIVDNKQAMLKALLDVRAQGDNFFNECCNVLVDEWGADRSHLSFSDYIRRLALCRQMEIWGITSNDLFSRAVKAHPHAVESHNGMINTELVPHPEKEGIYIVGKKPISYYRRHRIRKFSAEAIAICDGLSRQMADKSE